MYFFIHGGGLPKNYSDEGGGGHAKKIGNWGGGLYNFQITLLQIPPAPPYPIKNERSLRRVRSICLLGVLVAVEGEGWMVLVIEKYDYGIF